MLAAGLFYPVDKSDFCDSMDGIRRFIKKHFGHRVYRDALSAGRKAELEAFATRLLTDAPFSLSDASFDVFTYHGEDGILNYLINRLGNVPRCFVDIGAGDCIKSNCANLAIHFGWEGLFIDQDNKQLSVGKHFYKNLVKDGRQLSFDGSEVTPGNINDLIRSYVGKQPVGLLSIDIDGNDYWVWKAVTAIQPEVVVIEAKVEFGCRNLVVPYGPQNHRSVDLMFNGASVKALALLGQSKGYKLAGANKQGYNLFFVKKKSPLREVSAELLLEDPQVNSSFYPASFFSAHTFEKIS